MFQKRLLFGFSSGKLRQGISSQQIYFKTDTDFEKRRRLMMTRWRQLSTYFVFVSCHDAQVLKKCSSRMTFAWPETGVSAHSSSQAWSPHNYSPWCTGQVRTSISQFPTYLSLSRSDNNCPVAFNCLIIPNFSSYKILCIKPDFKSKNFSVVSGVSLKPRIIPPSDPLADIRLHHSSPAPLLSNALVTSTTELPRHSRKLVSR